MRRCRSGTTGWQRNSTRISPRNPPVRDLLVHRALARRVTRRWPSWRKRPYHISHTERTADEAEKDSV